MLSAIISVCAPDRYAHSTCEGPRDRRRPQKLDLGDLQSATGSASGLPSLTGMQCDRALANFIRVR